MEPFDLRLCPFFKAAGGDLSQPAIIEHVAIDSRRIFSPQTLFVALPGHNHDGHAFVKQAVQAGAKFALVNKTWRANSAEQAIQLLRVDSPLKAFQEIAKTYRQQRKNCKMIAIGGSHGKTMLKDLLENLLAKKYRVAASPESFNSQIGVPLSLLKIRDSHEIALIEAGFSMPNEMDALVDMIEPTHVILTSVAEKHLDSLNTFEKVIEETAKLLQPVPPNHWALISSHTPLTPYLQTFAGTLIYWDLPNSTLAHASSLKQQTQKKIPYKVQFSDQSIFQGEITQGYYYFLDLVNMASKAAQLLGISSEAITAELKQFTLEPTRTEIWKTSTNSLFINAPYCSDPQSIDQALGRLKQLAFSNERKVFIFGGMKGYSSQRQFEYRRIGQAICAAGVSQLMLVGEHAFEPLIEEIKSCCPDMRLSYFSSYTDALKELRQTAAEQAILIKGDRKLSFDVLTETFNDSLCLNQSLINLATIESNLKLIRQKLPAETRVMIMVKAFAYGTEDVQMAKFLSMCQIDILGVSYIDEAISLRRAGINQSLFSLNASIFEIPKIILWNIEIGVGDLKFISALIKETNAQKKSVKVHLHVDTGMNRFGCRTEDALELAQLIHAAPFVHLEGIMTHFACAEDPAHDSFTHQQIKKFDQVIAQLIENGIPIPWKHAANSSGMARFTLPQYNMVRIGLALYGLCSSPAVDQALKLKLALSLVSRLVGINLCKEGETISYGRNYVVEKPLQRIGVLPIGYFDGLHRTYSGKGWVLVHGQKAPMVGNICMDFMMIDLTHIPEAEVGDPVLIFGEDEHGNYLSPEELAAQGDSIVHELVTCIGPRIPRIFIHEESLSHKQNKILQ